MIELEFIWKNCIRIQDLTKSMSYKENDIRNEFYALLYDTYLNYYHGWLTIVLASETARDNIEFQPALFPIKQHLNRFKHLGVEPILTKSLFHSINKSLLLGIFTSFELSINTIADASISNEHREELKASDYNVALKAAKGLNLNEQHLDKLRKHFYKKDLWQLPLWRKFKMLLRENAGSYKRIPNNDIQFVRFFSDLRNSISHSNSIFFGKDYTHIFKQYPFRFENGKEFKYQIDEELISRLYIDLGNELMDIYTELIKGLGHIDFISYPDLELTES